MAFIYDLSDAWNNGATTFTAIKMNVTDSASSASSLLMDLQVGGVSKFNVRKEGNIGIGMASSVSFSVNAVAAISASQYSINASNGPIYWGDLQIHRDAANTLAQRNGVNAQTSRIYNTYTDASNYERGKISWSSNVLQIGTEKAGTGTARALELQTDGTTRLTIATSGNATLTGALTIGGSSPFSHSGRVVFSSPSAGIYTLQNNTQTDFDRLQFGGTTNSFGAIARDGAGVSFVGAAGGSTAHIKVPGVTVANLPAAATAGAGARSFVTDALAPVFGSAVAGSGAVNVPVYSDGSAWNVG
jgi:hypothetical protein